MAKVQAPSTERRPLTYEDYCGLPDDGRRYEVMDASLGAEEVYAPALFPALTIPLRELWG